MQQGKHRCKEALVVFHGTGTGTFCLVKGDEAGTADGCRGHALAHPALTQDESGEILPLLFQRWRCRGHIRGKEQWWQPGRHSLIETKVVCRADALHRAFLSSPQAYQTIGNRSGKWNLQFDAIRTIGRDATGHLLQDRTMGIAAVGRSGGSSGPVQPMSG